MTSANHQNAQPKITHTHKKSKSTKMKKSKALQIQKMLAAKH